jgi:hypothetical protein
MDSIKSDDIFLQILNYHDLMTYMCEKSLKRLMFGI